MHRSTCLGLRGVVFLAACSSLLVHPASLSAQGYTRTNLTSDVSGQTPNTDPNLVNSWGIAALPTSPWWVADNHTGLSTIYAQDGTPQSLVVTIPPGSANDSGVGNPTGIVANSTTDFGGALFIFDSEDGTISSWSSGTAATIQVDQGANAIYKGLTMGQINGNNVLYAANFHAGTVDVYDANFNWVSLAAGAFTDPQLPADFAPFNVQWVNGLVIVTFAQQDEDKEDEVAGAGLGFVEAFTPSGTLLRRFEHGPFLNAPWGVALAPSDFGEFSNTLLVGQFGGGLIVAYDATSGKAKGVLHNANGRPIIIPFLWGIGFGNGSAAGPTNSLYFAAGPSDETHGLFGVINANSGT
jgi:uncharacterized protein (TIGR03118 family)